MVPRSYDGADIPTEKNLRAAVVTGAAGGIGTAICERLGASGCAVAALDVSEQRLAALCQRLAEDGIRCEPLVCDVTSGQSVDSAVKATLQAFGKIDILVNNAGWDELHPFVETDEGLWERLVQINYLGVLRMCKAVVPRMIEANYGRIVNISSDAARVGSTGEAVYAGAKAALIGFSKSLAREVAKAGVTVNVVCPGPTETPLLDEIRTKSEQGERVIRSIARSIPMGRLGRPEDVAAAVAYFASEEAGYVTGQVLSVSGGLTMAG
jgi:2-hydroxycyclohexanecarboxyl-CoA dehydrogenase